MASRQAFSCVGLRYMELSDQIMFLCSDFEMALYFKCMPNSYFEMALLQMRANSYFEMAVNFKLCQTASYFEMSPNFKLRKQLFWNGPKLQMHAKQQFWNGPKLQMHAKQQFWNGPKLQMHAKQLFWNVPKLQMHAKQLFWNGPKLQITQTAILKWPQTTNTCQTAILKWPLPSNACQTAILKHFVAICIAAIGLCANSLNRNLWRTFILLPRTPRAVSVRAVHAARGGIHARYARAQL